MPRPYATPSKNEKAAKANLRWAKSTKNPVKKSFFARMAMFYSNNADLQRQGLKTKKGRF